jgi:hypothetical protein
LKHWDAPQAALPGANFKGKNDDVKALSATTGGEADLAACKICRGSVSFPSAFAV